MSYWLDEADFQYADDKYFYLYRHMSFQEYYLDSIVKQTLRFSSPLDFNDPFDCVFKINESPNANYFNGVLNRLKWSGSPAQRLQKRNTLKKSLMSIDGQKRFLKEHFEKFGVICLNHNPLNILMWSHYGDSHRGFLIELKFPKDRYQFCQNHFPPHPVIYSENYPVGRLDFFDIKTQQQMFCQKSIDWQYEKEYRLLASGFLDKADEQRVYTYPCDWLASVVVGCKCSEDNVKKITEIVSKFNLDNDKNIKLYRSIQSPDKFVVEVPQHPRLDPKLNKKRK
ncbi:hypothetical protein BKE30_09435 [Alkanindiges hydrocarboniclasticus]|uniref:DUF2971 domain-containing protein n=1 Tax=Alkanindiges hydrocarboniclasticus TaxID=1907941 RepID=A0A1S8CTB6_9GAMM|nr:DUF2971 domain-containing protein [Alkanindiges hydrocarboniclasticus]ONG39562.1 hypothetical protein BKE30_09435 [Alkanindiges hydrocarboniclasticus]